MIICVHSEVQTGAFGPCNHKNTSDFRAHALVLTFPGSATEQAEHNDRVVRFFELWRKYSDRIARALVYACGAIGLSVAWQAPSYGAPLWVAWTFGLFSVGIIVMNVFARPKPPRS